MSVAASVTLPAQPTTGVTRYIELGGDGLTSPKLVATCKIQVASDATSGTSTLTIFGDDTFVMIPNWIISGIQNTSLVGANLPLEQRVDNYGSGNDRLIYSSVAEKTVIGAAMTTLIPPPMIMEQLGPSDPLPSVNSIIANVDTETHTLIAQFFLFDRFARSETPIEKLLASIPRSSAQIPTV